MRLASINPMMDMIGDESSEIFYLRSDKKWEYTLIDDIWNTRKRDSDDSWISLKDDKFRKTRRKLDSELLGKGDLESTDTVSDVDECNFIIPIAWPTYEPKLEKGAGDFEVWGARVYAAIMSNDYTSKAGTYGKLGHGGVATVEQNGRVRLFEFGRYQGSSEGMGITLRSDLGKIAKFGEINDYCRISNIEEVVNAIKSNSYGEGKTLPMVGHVVNIPNVEGAITFANQSTQRKYKAIDLTIGDDAFNCGTFIYDVAEAGGLEMGSWCFPDPESVVDSFEDLSIQKIRA